MKRLIAGVGLAALGAALFTRLSVGQKLRSLRAAGPGLDDLHKDELYRKAQEADIPGRSQMTKQELIDALKDAD